MKPKFKTKPITESSQLLITGGRVIDPSSGIDRDMDVFLRDGRVAELASPGVLQASLRETLDARGCIVAPGFIDLHVHLREPGQSHKETIATGTAAAAAGGFTAVCAMPNTHPVNDSTEITRWMQAPERNAVVRLFPIAAATVGSQGEKLTNFAALQRAGAVAISDDGKPILDDDLMRNALRLGARLKLPIVQHAEDSHRTAGCSMNLGPTSFRLGLRGMSNAAESDIVARDIALAKETKAHIHVAHISTAEAMEAVRRAKKAGIRATAEVTPHHFTLIDENVGDFDTHYKMNPPLRSLADRQAMIAGIADGTIDAIATDHAPHAFHEKQVEFERASMGIIGLETALPIAITVLYHHFHLPLWRIVELLSSGPARVFRLSDMGTLAPGAHADVTIFDAEKKWTYDASKSRSKSRNTPYDGWSFTGKIVATVVAGKVVEGA
jgi:dihydroorotase